MKILGNYNEFFQRNYGKTIFINWSESEQEIEKNFSLQWNRKKLETFPNKIYYSSIKNNGENKEA